MPNAYELPVTYKNPYGATENGGYQTMPGFAPAPSPFQSDPRSASAPWNAGTPTAKPEGSQQRTPQANAMEPSAAAADATPGSDPVSTIGSWVDKGWVDGDGMVMLPWGVKVPIKEAIAMYYADKPPTADEVPPWIRMNVANEFTPTYWNQLPSQMRPFVQNMYDAARQASGASRTQYPAVASMTPQAQYYG